MGFRFQKRVKILPGVSLNFSKSGVSTSLGPRGAKVTIGHGKVRETVGIPGTGLSYTEVHRSGGARQPQTSGGVSGGVVLVAAFSAIVIAAAVGSIAYGIFVAIAIYFVAQVVKGFQSSLPDTTGVPVELTEDLAAKGSVLDANRQWLHERWLRADEARASGAHGEFPAWYFDAVTEPQLERLHRLCVKTDGAELTKGAASDLIGIFEPVDDGDAEVCRFFHVEIPAQWQNETRGRMEVARIFADPLNRTKWEEQGNRESAPKVEHGTERA